MTDSTLIEQAKLGDPDAIAALMNQSLQSKGLRAIVDRQGERLEVILEAERVPNRQALTGFVEKGISNLSIQTSPPIAIVRIIGRQTGASAPAWVQELKPDPLSSRLLPVDSLSIESETVPPPVGLSGIDHFSSAAVTSAAAFEADLKTTDWMDQPAPGLEADLSSLSLEALDDPSAVAEPDFLQELLSSSGDLPADEAMEPNDEGLLDFLNELSDHPSAEPFPDEAMQDLSNFEGNNPSEGNFQELFAESTEFSLESDSEPWEDSSESLPGGEPDADLLDFLATSDPESDIATDFSPQLAEIHEFPDAASIDQLPEGWLNETTAPPSNPLEEPSADFLTSLLDEDPSIPAEPFSATAPNPSVTAAWPEATPDSGEDLQQALVNSPLTDPWAEETAADAVLPTEQPEPETAFSPAPSELYASPDYELSSVGLSPEPEASPVEPPAEPPTWIQSTWIQPDTPEPSEATFLSESFPAEPVAEPSTWIQPDELEATLVEEEGLPDFLLEPRLDLPETDPVEMTYEEALQQPDVLDATLAQEPLSLEGSAAPDSPDLIQTADQPLAPDPTPWSDSTEWTTDEASTIDAAPVELASPEATDSSNFWPVDEPDTFTADFSQPEAEDFPEVSAQLPEDELIQPPVAEPGFAVEPDLAELSSFADQQSGELSWTETSEDVAVEEMPPDFLLELENEFLTGSRDVAASEPTWTALEADLAAVDLTADAPDLIGEPETTTAETPALNLEDLLSEETTPTAPEASMAEELTVTPYPEIELLSETAEGTAVEPPENWLASLREPVDLHDAEPEPAVAAEPPAVEPAAHLPLSADPIVSNVTQDELEAGLGDFREGFVEPLPPEFFEDETQSSYPDWRSELGDPLVVTQDGTGTGYIIEDSDEILPAVVPPAEAESDLEESVEPRSSEWIFPALLLTVCGLLAGWLGFSLFSARIGPRQPAPPPAAEPPAAPEQAPPAAPSPTSAQPTDSSVAELPVNPTDRNRPTV